MLSGQNYEKLKRCVCISVLGFNLDERPEYHKVYRLRDETGHEFSDMFEIHVIELNKPLNGLDRIDEWIQLFNAKSEEELDMLQSNTKSAGILEAIRELKVMRMGKMMKTIYDGYEKQRRDRHARDVYVRNEGIKAGLIQGSIQTYQELGLSKEDTLHKIQEKFSLNEKEAEGYLANYWK